MFKDKRFWIIFFGTALLTVAVLFALAPKAVAPPHNNPKSSYQNGQQVAIEGEVECLPHKNSSGPQTLECAFGIKADNGEHYALQDPAPNYEWIGKLPTGKRAKVTGTFKAPVDSKDDTVGTITISSVAN